MHDTFSGRYFPCEQEKGARLTAVAAHCGRFFAVFAHPSRVTMPARTLFSLPVLLGGVVAISLLHGRHVHSYLDKHLYLCGVLLLEAYCQNVQPFLASLLSGTGLMVHCLLKWKQRTVFALAEKATLVHRQEWHGHQGTFVGQLRRLIVPQGKATRVVIDHHPKSKVINIVSELRLRTSVWAPYSASNLGSACLTSWWSRNGCKADKPGCVQSFRTVNVRGGTNECAWHQSAYMACAYRRSHVGGAAVKPGSFNVRPAITRSAEFWWRSVVETRGRTECSFWDKCTRTLAAPGTCHGSDDKCSRSGGLYFVVSLQVHYTML